MSSEPGSSETGTDVLPEDRSAGGRTRARVQRHVRWVRRDGLARMIEEDDLHPWERLQASVEGRRWRARHGVPAGSARAVFVVGVQRSGTNMVVRGFERRPEIEVHNENDRAVFERFQLRDDDVVRDVVRHSRHAIVMFKPLCDSHRTADLLAMTIPKGFVSAGLPRAVWVYRGVDGRARSAVRKFGDVNRRVLAEIARGDGRDRWQAQRMSDSSLELVRRCDPERLSPESAAALFWVVRNRLYFEQGLHLRPDVHLASYDRFVAEPEDESLALAAFLGVEPGAELWAHVDRRSAYTPPLDLDRRVRDAAEELEAELWLTTERCNRRAFGV
ncbi:hypothetical protein [Nocardioides sp. SR21]|uniref:hypothetical protein n=1 Tax=Nocardioides sp. SR21 TaxID=2919501 RepID=UPI001FAB1503|nr:hypothetical protein [Nocardioides sp. SR21]